MKKYYRTPEELNRQIASSMGDTQPDLLIKNGTLVNVATGEIYQADIATKDDIIVRVGDCSDFNSKYSNLHTIDATNSYIIPGLIDSHLHTESTLLTPTNFTTITLPRGTTTVVVDPHEIGNVLGLKGLELYIQETISLPLEFLVEVPSCVPAAPSLETSSNILTNKELQPLLEDNRYFALAEMMNFPGVIFRDPDVLAKLSIAEKNHKILEGHSPGLRGKELQAYLTAGIRSCHESFQVDEVIEKLRLGVSIQLREGSFAKNLLHLGKGIKNNLQEALSPWNHVIIASDDRHADDLVDFGHLDHSLRLLVNEVGLDPVTAIQICTINPARHLLRPDIGMVAPGRKANFSIINNLSSFTIKDVVSQGKHVAHNGKLLTPLSDQNYPDWALKTVKPKFIPKLEDFTIQSPKNIDEEKITAHIIGGLEHSLITDHIMEPVKIEENQVVIDYKQKDLSYFFLLDRYGTTNHFSKSLVTGFKFDKLGAFASTVAHDSHQLIVAGNDPQCMFNAVKSVISIDGGLAITSKLSNDKIEVSSLGLPYAGLMSIEAPYEVGRKFKILKEKSKELTSGISEPFMALSFMALPVIPKLKLTDKGLVDVDKFEIIPLFDLNN
jgi:adenine deaminase